MLLSRSTITPLLHIRWLVLGIAYFFWLLGDSQKVCDLGNMPLLCLLWPSIMVAFYFD